jgi:ABC-type multidrug transport system fused ATPase/permease subunit
MIGERGGTLSAGQRRQFGIVRAFIRNAPILILDEPTASLDPESEQVMEGLDRLMTGPTVVMITHRLNTVRRAHAILVLHDGEVAEQGGHDDLIARGGVYAGLYRAEPAARVVRNGVQSAQPAGTELAWDAR